MSCRSYKMVNLLDHFHLNSKFTRINLLIIFLLLLIQRSNGSNSIWDSFQPKLKRLVDSFEKSCEKQHVDFDRNKMEKELQACFQPPMSQLMNMINSRGPNDNLMLVTVVEKLKRHNPSISHQEIQFLSLHLIEPVCYFSTSILECFNPHYNHIVESCTTDPEGAAMHYSDQILMSACRHNGSTIIDFLEVGGIECIDLYFTHGLECFQHQNISFSTSMELLKDGSEPKSLVGLCSDLEEIHDCLINNLIIKNICDKGEATRMLHSFIDKIKSWTSDTCFIRNDASKLSFTLILVILQCFVKLQMLYYS